MKSILRFVIIDRKIPLIEIRRKLLFKQKQYLRTFTDDDYDEMDKNTIIKVNSIEQINTT